MRLGRWYERRVALSHLLVAEQDWIVRHSTNFQDWSEVTRPIVDTALEHTVTIPRGSDPELFVRLEK